MIKTLFAAVNHGVNLLRNSFRDIKITTKRSSKWPKVEKDFKEKNPNCACCGSNIRIQVHHKKPFHLDPSLELDINNLISLCMSKKECHLMIGHGNDFKSYNPNIERDAHTLNKDISKFSIIAAKAKANRLYQ